MWGWAGLNICSEPVKGGLSNKSQRVQAFDFVANSNVYCNTFDSILGNKYAGYSQI